MAFLSFDRLSSQFVVVSAGPTTTIDAASFKECWSTYLGMSRPAYSLHAGVQFTDCRRHRKTVDRYGHSVYTTIMHDGLWRKRHDEVKLTIKSLSDCMVWDGPRQGGRESLRALHPHQPLLRRCTWTSVTRVSPRLPSRQIQHTGWRENVFLLSYMMV